MASYISEARGIDSSITQMINIEFFYS